MPLLIESCVYKYSQPVQEDQRVLDVPCHQSDHHFPAGQLDLVDRWLQEFRHFLVVLEDPAVPVITRK